MKKVMSLILVAAMLVVMLVGFTGCGSNEAEKFVGTWSTDVDLADMINEELATDPTIAEYIVLDSFMITMQMTFNEDGTYFATFDEASIQTALDEMMVVIEDGVTRMMEDEIAAAGLDMSVEDLLAMSDMTLEDLMAEMTAALDGEAMIAEMMEESLMEGNYEATSDKLFLSDGLDYDVDEEVYELYEMDGSTLTLLENVGGDEDDLFGLYPLTFTKAA